MKETALYIHIPFCDHKCIYCDFYSIITSDNVEAFLHSLKAEINFYSEKYNGNRKFISVFFGGGTPSLMEPDYISQIIAHLKSRFNISEDAEITLETNPGTVNNEKLAAFKQAGINRISIGIQSFHNDELKFLTRIHDSQTAIKTVWDAANAGFENISIDLIFNLPGQTKSKWLANLKQSTALPVKHISAYSLILERGTILNKMVLDGKVKMQDVEIDADLYETTIDYLAKKGFYQYEVSNFTKPGYECVHNNAYWRYKEYLGLGTSSHSFINGKRWWNFSSLKRYINEIHKKGNAVANEEQLTIEQMHDEYVMLTLRSRGIDLEEYKKKFKADWINKNYSYFQKLKDEDLIVFDEEKIKLTKKGYLLCDEILKNLL